MSPRDRILSIAIVIGGGVLALLLYLFLPALFAEPATQKSKPPAVSSKPVAPDVDLWSWAKSEIAPHVSAPPDDTAAKKTNPVVEPEEEKSGADDADGDEPVDLYASCDPLEGEEAAACIERIDQRIETLRDACDRYDDDNEHWLDCMEAAGKAKEY